MLVLEVKQRKCTELDKENGCFWIRDPGLEAQGQASHPEVWRTVELSQNSLPEGGWLHSGFLQLVD